MWFVRVIDPRDGPIWVKAPPDWVQTVVQRIPIPEWGVSAERAIPTVRLPQDALRDYAIASRTLFDGRLIQVGRSADNRAVLLAPLRRAFGAVGAVVLFLSVAAGTVLAWRATRPLREVSDTARRILETGSRTLAGDGAELLSLAVAKDVEVELGKDPDVTTLRTDDPARDRFTDTKGIANGKHADQEEDRDQPARQPEAPDEADAVKFRQHHVDDRRVVIRRLGQG